MDGPAIVACLTVIAAMWLMALFPMVFWESDERPVDP